MRRFSLCLLVLLCMSFCGCSSKNPESLIAGKYKLENSRGITAPYVLLRGNQSIFQYSLLSSYFNQGTYKIEDNTLILTSDFLSYIEDNSTEKQNVFGNFITQQEFVEFMISCNMDQFIDYEKKECHFDTDNFTTLISTASGLAPHDENYDDNFEIYSGTQPISFQWIRGIYDIDMLSALFKDNYAITTLASGAAKNTGALMLPTYNFGMSASSEHKDGVWEFLKWLYSDEFQELMSAGIPMSKTAFDAQWDIIKKVLEDDKNLPAGTTYLTMVDGVEQRTFIECSKDRAACYQKTIDLIDSIDRLYQVDTTVMNIISEDISAYFYGDKSAKDTAAIIQSRVNLYLNE